MNLVGKDLVKSGDIGVILVRSGKDVCLAVVEILSFEQPGNDKIRLTAIDADDP